MKEWNSVLGTVTGLVRPIVGLALLVLVGTLALKMFGVVRFPVATPSTQELAYLAGSYWLLARAS